MIRCIAPRTRIGLVLLLGLVTGCGLREPPNVVIVTLDTLRADHLGCYGYERDTSPHIDSFAEQATLYRRAMSSAPWTVPSHASMFTGLFPFEHGARTYKADSPVDLVHALDPAHVTLAEVLRAEGYQTAAFVANSAYMSRAYRLDQGFETYQVEYLRWPDLNERALQWLRIREERPFFLFLNYMDTHREYNSAPRPGLFDRPVEERSGPLLDELIERVLPGRQFAPMPLVERVVAHYDAAVANVDEGVGSFFSELRALGLWDGTLILITSDHGEYFGEHQLVEHSKDVYQEVLWIPFLLKSPGQRRGASSDTLISSVDVPRMILSHLPARIARSREALFPYAPGEHAVIAENYYTRAGDLYDRRWGHRFDRVRTALYDWPYKLIRSSDGEHELYHLERDPLEGRNLYGREPEIARRLLEALEGFQLERRGSTRSGDPVAIDPELREQLRSLGYLD